MSHLILGLLLLTGIASGAPDRAGELKKLFATWTDEASKQRFLDLFPSTKKEFIGLCGKTANRSVLGDCSDLINVYVHSLMQEPNHQAAMIERIAKLSTVVPPELPSSKYLRVEWATACENETVVFVNSLAKLSNRALQEKALKFLNEGPKGKDLPTFTDCLASLSKKYPDWAKILAKFTRAKTKKRSKSRPV